MGQAELYLRLVNSRDTASQDALNPQPLQHYFYRYPSMVRPYSEEIFFLSLLTLNKKKIIMAQRAEFLRRLRDVCVGAEKLRDGNSTAEIR